MVNYDWFTPTQPAVYKQRAGLGKQTHTLDLAIHR